jgi:hypothetical protein
MRLHTHAKTGIASVSGELLVPVGAGMLRAFEVEVRYNEASVFKPPTTQDAGRSFEWIADRHIGGDGTMCLWLPQLAPRDFADTFGLALHLDRVREFLILQIMFDDRLRRGIEPPWPGDAWGHGDKGGREWVREEVVGLDANALRRLLPAIVSRRPHRGARCPCVSGRAFKDCHAEWVSRMDYARRNCHGVCDELLALAKANDTR